MHRQSGARGIRLVGMLLVMAIGMVSTRALAAEMSDARQQYEQAKRAYNLNSYEEALGGFDKLYRQTGDPALLFNIGQCHRQLGHTQDALKSYRAYLRENPRAPNRQQVEAQIQELELRVGQPETPPAPVAAPVTPVAPVAPITPAAPSPAAPPAAAPIPSPPVLVTAAPSAQPDEGGRFYTRWWFWTGVGVAVAAGVVTAVILASRSDDPHGTMDPGVVVIR